MIRWSTENIDLKLAFSRVTLHNNTSKDNSSRPVGLVSPTIVGQNKGRQKSDIGGASVPRYRRVTSRFLEAASSLDGADRVPPYSRLAAPIFLYI